MCACSVTQSCPPFCDPMDCSPWACLSLGFSRQENWSGLPFPPPGGLPYPGIQPASSVTLALANGFFTTEPSGKPRAGLPFWILILIVWYWGWLCCEEPELILRPHDRSYFKIYPAYLTGYFLLLFSSSVLSYSSWLHRLQHARLPCPSPFPGVCSDSCPLSW